MLKTASIFVCMNIEFMLI